MHNLNRFFTSSLISSSYHQASVGEASYQIPVVFSQLCSISDTTCIPCPFTGTYELNEDSLSVFLLFRVQFAINLLSMLSQRLFYPTYLVIGCMGQFAVSLFRP